MHLRKYINFFTIDTKRMTLGIKAFQTMIATGFHIPE